MLKNKSRKDRNSHSTELLTQRRPPIPLHKQKQCWVSLGSSIVVCDHWRLLAAPWEEGRQASSQSSNTITHINLINLFLLLLWNAVLQRFVIWRSFLKNNYTAQNIAACQDASKLLHCYRTGPLFLPILLSTSRFSHNCPNPSDNSQGLLSAAQPVRQLISGCFPTYWMVHFNIGRW